MLTDRKIIPPPEGPKTGPQAMPAAYDNYYSRLIKLVPAEIIALYLAVDGIASALPHKDLMLWIVFGISLAGAWIYLGRMANVTGFTQRLLTVSAFVLWVYLLGGPFTGFPWYDVNYGKLLVVLFTFFVPLFFKGENNAS